MNKKIIFATLLVVGIGLFIVFDQMRHTTFEKVISQAIGGNETITSIIITDFDTHKEFKTEDKSFIEGIVSVPSEMELKANNNNYGYSYYIVFNTNEGNKYGISLAEEGMVIHNAAQQDITGGYEAISDNELYQFIERKELEWGNL